MSALIRKPRQTTVPLDVRLNNTSQLAGFSKKPDLKFFSTKLIGAEYVELRELASKKEILRKYQNKELIWQVYAEEYVNLLARRRVEGSLDMALFDRGCLLCSEDRPNYCHRRLAVEYLNSRWSNQLKVTHLL